jgi:hypothetical protein
MCTVAGYAVGLLLAILFNSDKFDANSGIYTDNAWAIWTISFLLFIFVGIMWEIISKFCQKYVK